MWILPNCGCHRPAPAARILLNSKADRQIGSSTDGMPPLLAYEGSDGVLELVDGVTRASRVAKLLPGTKVRVEVLGKLKGPKAESRKVGDTL